MTSYSVNICVYVYDVTKVKLGHYKIRGLRDFFISFESGSIPSLERLVRKFLKVELLNQEFY